MVTYVYEIFKQEHLVSKVNIFVLIITSDTKATCPLRGKATQVIHLYLLMLQKGQADE